MGVCSRINSPRTRFYFARILGVMFLLVLALRGGGDWLETAQASAGFSYADADGDGLLNILEGHLSADSTDPGLAANPYNADSDGDGQPDGFEYCLSNRTSVVSPGVVHSMVPKITLGSHQEGDSLVLSIYVIPGEVSHLDRFHFLAAAPSVTGQTVVVEATELLVENIGQRGSASLVRHGPYSMAVYRARTSIPLMSAFSSLAFAVLAEVAGETVGDSATFTVHNGTAYRWNYHSTAGPAGGGGSGDSEGEAEPQQDPGTGSLPQRICLSSEVSEPSEIPGVLVTVPISTGCATGNWQCDSSVCSDGGPASQPKVVLDHLQLLW